MSARSLIATVSLIAVLACTGGPTSDYPFDDSDAKDAGVRGPDDEDKEPTFGGAGSSMDAGAANELDAASPVQVVDAGGSTATPCVDAALLDGGVPDASDGAIDAGDAALDSGDTGATPAIDGGDAALNDDAGDAQIEAGANFSDASSDAALSPADAASDAPYIGPDAAPCVP